MDSHPNSCFFSFSPQVTKLSLFYSKSICVSKRTHLGILQVWSQPTGTVDSFVNVFTVSANICPPIQSFSISLICQVWENRNKEYSCSSQVLSKTKNTVMYFQETIIQALTDPTAKL